MSAGAEGTVRKIKTFYWVSCVVGASIFYILPDNCMKLIDQKKTKYFWPEVTTN